MTHPRLTFLRMVLFLVGVSALAFWLYPTLERLFWNAPELNALICGALGVGLIVSFRPVIALWHDVAWLSELQGGDVPLSRRPVFLAPLSHIVSESKGNLRISAVTGRSLLDGLLNRVDEARELSRYFIGLLIFLGLLGTFWGLLKTITSISDVIGSLSAGNGQDVTALFAQLQKGLEAPLSNMGTAFSASLFGLTGSLILGFLDLQAGRALNRFSNEVENWLAGLSAQNLQAV